MLTNNLSVHKTLTEGEQSLSKYLKFYVQGEVKANCGALHKDILMVDMTASDSCDKC